MRISKRLKAITNMLDYDITSIADIGCDHGYVPIYACRYGRINRAYAVDINKGPLEKAVKNAKQYGLEELIVPVLCNGLTGISPGQVDGIVIAGMGGMLICEILRNSPEVVNSLHQIILQPQLDIEAVRRVVHELGFMIADERIVSEDGKYYSIINCHKGIDVLYNHIDYLFGKILIARKDSNLKEMLKQELREHEVIKKQMECSHISSNAAKRLSDINESIKIYKEVLTCL